MISIIHYTIVYYTVSISVVYYLGLGFGGDRARQRRSPLAGEEIKHISISPSLSLYVYICIYIYIYERERDIERYANNNIHMRTYVCIAMPPWSADHKINQEYTQRVQHGLWALRIEATSKPKTPSHVEIEPIERRPTPLSDALRRSGTPSAPRRTARGSPAATMGTVCILYQLYHIAFYII